MQDEIEQIVTDPRLTSDAVRLVLLVRGMGAGEHEISENELLVLLPDQQTGLHSPRGRGRAGVLTLPSRGSGPRQPIRIRRPPGRAMCR